MSGRWEIVAEVKKEKDWDILAKEEELRLKEDARNQCLKLVDDTLPPGVNLIQDEDGWGGEWRYDFLQEAISFWDSLPSEGDKSPNKKGNNVSTSPTSSYNIATGQTGIQLLKGVEFDTQLEDGCDIVSSKKLFAEMVVHWFEGHKKLRGISAGEWMDYGFWGSSKFAEMKDSPVFSEVSSIFEAMEDDINSEGESQFIRGGAPIKVRKEIHWPIINRLFQGYKEEIPNKFSFNPHAVAFVPVKRFDDAPICI